MYEQVELFMNKVNQAKYQNISHTIVRVSNIIETIGQVLPCDDTLALIGLKEPESIKIEYS